jgi:hypothetical protein
MPVIPRPSGRIKFGFKISMHFVMGFLHMKASLFHRCIEFRTRTTCKNQYRVLRVRLAGDDVWIIEKHDPEFEMALLSFVARTRLLSLC